MLEGRPHSQSFADVIVLCVFVCLAAVWVPASLHKGLGECPQLTEVREFIGGQCVHMLLHAFAQLCILCVITLMCACVLFWMHVWHDVCNARKLYHQLMEEILYNPHTMEDAGDMVDHVSQHYIIPLYYWRCDYEYHACSRWTLTPPAHGNAILKTMTFFIRLTTTLGNA